VQVHFDSPRSYWYFSYSWAADDYSSSSSSWSSSSSHDGGGIVFVIALVAFLLGCVLGLLLAVWLATRNAKKKAQATVDIPLQSEPLLGVQTQFPQSSPYPYPPMVPTQEQLFNPAVMGLGLPQGSYVPAQGMQVPVQMPFYPMFGTPAVAPQTQQQPQQKSSQ